MYACAPKRYAGPLRLDECTLTKVHTLQNVLGNKYVENMTKDPKSLLRLAKKKEPRRQKLIYVIIEKEKKKKRFNEFIGVLRLGAFPD